MTDRRDVAKASRNQRQTIRNLQQENDRLRDMLIEAEDRNRQLEERLASMKERADVEA